MTLLERRDRVQEICQNPGTGDFDLLGAVDVSYITFAAAVPSIDGDFVPYCARHRSSGQWEVGVGLYDEATESLTRYDVLRTSAGGTSAIDFAAGIVDVWIDYAAEKSVMLDADSDDLHLPAAVSAVGAGTFGGAISAGASSSVNAGDADTDFLVGSTLGAPTAARVASVTINAPDSGSFRGSARLVLKRAASVLWSVGLFASVAGAMTSVTDYAWDPGTGTPVAAVSAVGALKLSAGLTATSGTFTTTLGVTGATTLTSASLSIGGLAYTFPGSQSANAYLKTNGSGVLTWSSVLETIALTDLSDVTITGQATGDLFYASSPTLWVNLGKGSNANVVLGQSGGIPAWTAAPIISAGSDASTTVTVGEGGAAPGSSRTAKLVINTPDSVSNRGLAYVETQRNSVATWRAGLFAAVAGTLGAISDYGWAPGNTTPVASISATGLLTLALPLLTSSGGTGNSSYSAGDINYYASGTAFTKLAIGAAGTLLRSSGTAPAWSTATFPTTATTGDLLYGSASNTWTQLAIGSNTNTLLGQSGGVPAWMANVTLSSGTDASTALTVGTGGASPTSGRTARVFLNTPDSVGNRGTAGVIVQRASANQWFFGNDSSTTENAKSAITDFQFYAYAGVGTVMALTIGGQLRTTGGYASVTAISAPSLAATQFTGFASTVNGAVVQGFGTTYDTALSNRAGTVVLGVTANTTGAVFTGTVGMGALTATTGTFTAVVKIDTALAVAPSLLIGTNAVIYSSAEYVTIKGPASGYPLTVSSQTAARPSLSLVNLDTGLTDLISFRDNTGTVRAWVRMDQTVSNLELHANFGLKFLYGSTLAHSIVSGGANVFGTTDPGGSDLIRASGNMTMSSGTDTNTLLQVGTGGASPTTTRAARLILNTPHSVSNIGASYVTLQRAGTGIWGFGIDATVSGAKGANTDLYFQENVGSAYVASLSTTGTFTVSGLLISQRGGSTMTVRLYSATSGGHQWDIYGSGTSLRISDNTGGGTFQVDTTSTLVGLVTGTAGFTSPSLTPFRATAMQGGNVAFLATVNAAQQAVGAQVTSDGGTQLQNATAGVVEYHIRPNAGMTGYLSFTENSVADLWSVGIKNADSNLYFTSGRGMGATTRVTFSAVGLVSGSAFYASGLPASFTDADGATVGYVSSTAVFGPKANGANNRSVALRPLVAGTPTAGLTINEALLATFAGAVTSTGLLSTVAGFQFRGATATNYEVLRLTGATNNPGLFVSATEATKHVSLFASGSAVTGQQLKLGAEGVEGVLTIEAAKVTIASGAALKVGNAAAVGVGLVSTHSITLQDSTGTTYRVPILV